MLHARRALLSVVALVSLAGCLVSSHDLSGWVLGPKRQSIDTDVAHWERFSFSEGVATITIKVPPRFRSFEQSKLPEADFDSHSVRRLLSVQYDYRSQSIEELSQFEVRAVLLRLDSPQSAGKLDSDAWDRAIRTTAGRKPRFDDDPPPPVERIQGRAWMHTDSTGSAICGPEGEAYATRISPDRVLFINALYLGELRSNAEWLAIRRRLLLSSVEHAVIPSHIDSSR